MENQTQVKLNRELAQMLKGGVIMDVTTPGKDCRSSWCLCRYGTGTDSG